MQMAIVKVCKVAMQLCFRISCLMLLFLSEATNDLKEGIVFILRNLYELIHVPQLKARRQQRQAR